MELVLEKCIFPELFFWKQNCRTFSFLFHFKRTKCINLVPGRTCLSLCEGSSVYTGNQRAGDFNLTFSLSLRNKPRQYKRDLLRDWCSCTALILAPWSVYLLPSRKSQSLGKLPRVGWLKSLCLPLGSAHASFFISHLMCFSSLALSSPPPLPAGSLAVACFSLNLSDCKLVCSDPGSESTMAGIQLSNRMESFFWFGLLDISSYCRVCSRLVSAEWIKCHLEGSIPWCSWSTELLMEKDVGVCGCVPVVSWPISSLQCYYHSYSHMFHFCSIHWGRLFNFPHWYQQLPPLCCWV